MIQRSYKHFWKTASTLRWKSGWRSELRSESPQSVQSTTNPPRSPAGSNYPLKHHQIREDGPEQLTAVVCNKVCDPIIFSHWIGRIFSGAQLTSESSWDLETPWTLSLNLIHATLENLRMRWTKFKRGKEYKAIFWKHTCILYTLNKSPVHVCDPVRLCIIIYHCLRILSAFV